VLDGPSQQIVYSNLLQILEAGRAQQAPATPVYDEAKIAYGAIAHHVRALTHLHLGTHAPPVPMVNPQFGDVGARRSPVMGGLLFADLPDDLIADLERNAAVYSLTLNSIFLGTLASHVHVKSGMGHFTIAQVYLARGLDETHAVGSYSTIGLLGFTFGEQSTLLSTCQHVLAETVRHIRALSQDLLGPPTGIPLMSYELNDCRPMTRPPKTTLPPENLAVDLTIMINRFSDGYQMLIVYNATRFEHKWLEEFVQEWMVTWLDFRNSCGARG